MECDIIFLEKLTTKISVIKTNAPLDMFHKTFSPSCFVWKIGDIIAEHSLPLGTILLAGVVCLNRRDT
jgi:hypothetical protein